MVKLNRLILPFLISDTRAWVTPSRSAASVWVNPDLFNHLLRRKQFGAHFQFGGFFLGEEVVEY